MTKVDEVDEFLQKYLQKEDQKTLDKIVNSIEKVVKQIPTIYDEDQLKEYLTKRSALLKKLVDEYLNTIISQEFPRISENLFELKKKLLLKKEKGKLTIIKDNSGNILTKEEAEKIKNKEYYEVEMPLFVYTNLLKPNSEVEITKIKIKAERTNYYGTRYDGVKTISIDAKFSERTYNSAKENYEKGIEALSKYYSTLKNAYKNQTLKELLMQTEIEQPTMGVVWSPSADELSIKPDENMRKDKSKISSTIMLVLDLKEKQYLISTLKTKEDSVDKYLKELAVEIEK